MSKEFDVEGVWPCRLDVNKKYIAEGTNSVVFRVNDYALKVYNGRSSWGSLNINKLLFYNEITDKTYDLAKSENWTIKLPFPFGRHIIEVNRFVKVNKCDKCGYVEAWTPFIVGTRLDLFPFSLIQNNLTDQFDNLKYQTEKCLGIEGIEIAPINVKINSSLTVVITDLCWDIANLGPKTS